MVAARKRAARAGYPDRLSEPVAGGLGCRQPVSLFAAWPHVDAQTIGSTMSATEDTTMEATTAEATTAEATTAEATTAEATTAEATTAEATMMNVVLVKNPTQICPLPELRTRNKGMGTRSRCMMGNTGQTRRNTLEYDKDSLEA